MRGAAMTRVCTGRRHASKLSWHSTCNPPRRWFERERGFRRILGGSRRRPGARADGRRPAALADAFDCGGDNLLRAPDQHWSLSDLWLLQCAEPATPGARIAAHTTLRQREPHSGLPGPRALRGPPGGPSRTTAGRPTVRGGIPRFVDPGHRPTRNVHLPVDRRRLSARRRVSAVATGGGPVARRNPG